MSFRQHPVPQATPWHPLLSALREHGYDNKACDGQESPSHELPVIIECFQLLNKPQVPQPHMPQSAQLALDAPSLQTKHAEQPLWQ